MAIYDHVIRNRNFHLRDRAMEPWNSFSIARYRLHFLQSLKLSVLHLFRTH